MLDALGLPGVTLVNLQYGEHSDSIASAEARTGKRLLASGIDNSNDLDGLASVVAAMDLVVCIGHTTAHMAGAIGAPNYVLLPAAPFAHWLAAGERCIWYPATKLFRQAPVDDSWSAVLSQVKEAVSDFTASLAPDSWLAQTLLPGSVSARAVPMSPRDLQDAILAFFAQGAYRSALQLMDRLSTDNLPSGLKVL
jgi:hypothetical protein